MPRRRRSRAWKPGQPLQRLAPPARTSRSPFSMSWENMESGRTIVPVTRSACLTSDWGERTILHVEVPGKVVAVVDTDFASISGLAKKPDKNGKRASESLSPSENRLRRRALRRMPLGERRVRAMPVSVAKLWKFETRHPIWSSLRKSRCSQSRSVGRGCCVE